MIINLYKYSGEHNRLDKTNLLSDVISLQGTARESIDRMTTSVLIEYSGTLSTYNYAFIDEFNRYYFIESDTIERNGIHRLQLTTDVLMSHKTGILNSYGIVARNENLYNARLIDDRLRFLGYKEINTIKLGGSVKNGDTFILAVNGG